ncbi:MAG: MBL fold metallo-hydrolase [Lachnospiraceae bacterium]|nr:MBL fold metallo-hydrolase [Lachnospiraceae bacterium]
MKKQTIKQDGLCIQVYSFELMDSRMYMIREDDEIFVVDPCIDNELLRDAQGAKHAVVFLTHEHYDHISGVNWLKEHFSCSVYAGKICSGRVESEKDNLSSRFPFLFLLDREKYDYVRRNFSLPYTCKVETYFSGKGELLWKGHLIELYEVGGHSPGSSFIVFDKSLLFGGDNILDNGKELWGTDGNYKYYHDNVLPMLREFDQQIVVLPGHGEKNRLGYFLEKIHDVGVSG